MRENRKRHERGGGEGFEQSEAETLAQYWIDAYESGYDEGFEEGFDAGVEEAKQQFMQTQLLLLHTGGNA